MRHGLKTVIRSNRILSANFMKKHFIIYKITNLINGKIYIGQHQTYNLDDGYMGSSIILNNAIEKYGIENFKKEIIRECENFDEMNRAEAEIVDKDFVDRSDTYNVSVGGTFGWENCNKALRNNEEKEQLRRKHSAEQVREYIRMHPEFGNRISNGLKRYYSKHESVWVGRHHKESTKEKIGKANSVHQQGKGNSHYGTHWWKDPNDKTKTLCIKEGDPVPEGWIRGRWQQKKK